MIALEPSEIEIVKIIIRKYLPDCEVRVFGSRLDPNPKTYADLDLVLVCQDKISRQTLIAIQDEFAESALTFRVDLLDWQRISPEFRQIIMQRFEVLS